MIQNIENFLGELGECQMKFSEVVLPSNRKFGFFFAVVFLILGCYFFFVRETNILALVSLILAICLSLMALLKADLLLPLNKAWMAIGFLLGMIVSPIILGVIPFP